MRVQFQLATIDSALDDLKAKTRPHGEIITFLPTGEGGDTESVELEILVASRASARRARGAVAGPNIAIEEVRRRDGGPTPRRSESMPAAAAPDPASTPIGAMPTDEAPGARALRDGTRDVADVRPPTPGAADAHVGRRPRMPPVRAMPPPVRERRRAHA